PLEGGALDEDPQIVFAKPRVPIPRQFEPDLLIVSAGFDAHQHDPLGGMRLSTESFAAMTMELRAVADECCRGRLVAAVEGGYDLQAFAASLDAAIDALGGPVSAARWPSSGIASSRGNETVATV